MRPGHDRPRTRCDADELETWPRSPALDQEHAAEAVACSTAKISRIESGAVSARVGDVRVLLDLYEVEDEDERKLLEKLARDSNKRGWWMDFKTDQPMRDILGDFLALESDATYIRTSQPLLVPGLLQTPDYTRALTDASPDVVDGAAADLVVKVRQERRRVFEEKGARFAAVIWEPALIGRMPDPAVQREQLVHLIRMAKRPNVTIQVLPVSEWAAARVSSAFVGFSYTRETAPEVVVHDTVSNCIILEDPDVMVGYVHAFDTLRSAALTPSQSVAFMQSAMNSIPEENEES
ncbi:helix-turn-helix domain-containing protein [Streptomyces sp. NPDC014622]|uniref:helix-turn-helix domain-containing protein n=1 Tax=Streptomyces sp. NPDC014622 TaxID=3364874 RepID=UPI0036F9E87F